MLDKAITETALGAVGGENMDLSTLFSEFTTSTLAVYYGRPVASECW